MASDTEPKFRGVWIPADIMQMMLTGKITARETLLLALIESLVDSQGCRASNAWLAQKMGITRVGSVTEMISHLKAIGLLKQIAFDGHRRYLETAWSRVLPPAAYTETVEAAYTETVEAAYTETVYEREKREKRDKSTACVLATPNMPLTHILANTLASIVQKQGYPVTGIAKWAKYIEKMIHADGILPEDITVVLEWYKTAIGDKYVPCVMSAAALRTKWPNLLAAYRRSGAADITLKTVKQYRHHDTWGGIARYLILNHSRWCDGDAPLRQRLTIVATEFTSKKNVVEAFISELCK